MITLMAQIRALGHLPRMTRGLGDEYSLALRLANAKSRSLLSESQLAELAELPALDFRAERMDALMTEIRALGHIPRQTKSLGDERSLAQRLRNAKSKNLLSESQLAELAELPVLESREVRRAARFETLMGEIRALGHIPRCSVEGPLYHRLSCARRRGALSESQLAELAEIARSSVEPVRKRLRVLND